MTRPRRGVDSILSSKTFWRVYSLPCTGHPTPIAKAVCIGVRKIANIPTHPTAYISIARWIGNNRTNEKEIDMNEDIMKTDEGMGGPMKREDFTIVHSSWECGFTVKVGCA